MSQFTFEWWVVSKPRCGPAEGPVKAAFFVQAERRRRRGEKQRVPSSRNFLQKGAPLLRFGRDGLTVACAWYAGGTFLRTVLRRAGRSVVDAP